MSNKRIGLFGLSANPPTGENGHRGIIKYLQSLSLFDEIIILPVYQHMYRDKTNMLDFNHRINMCNLNFMDLNDTQKYDCKILVSDLERQMYLANDNKAQRLGTIDLLNFLLNLRKNENNSYHFILGMDTFCDLMKGKWKQSDKIVEIVTFEVFYRSFTKSVNIDDILIDTITYPLIKKAKFNFYKLQNLSDISSTSIRNYDIYTNFNINNPYNSLYQPVLEYIQNNQLYSYSIENKATNIQRLIIILSLTYITLLTFKNI